MTQPCTQCGASPSAKQSFMFVMSFLVFTRNAKYEAVLCRGCSTRRALQELGKSAVLGWWGFPWGLLTFQALAVNTRTLLRWSSIGAAGALLVGALSLSIPASVGYWAYLTAQDQALAKATGDWVDEEVVDLVEKGHTAANSGDHERALEFYLEASERAPNSSVINYQVALMLNALGRLDEALPYAAHAESLATKSAEKQALHGYLLAATGDEQAARARAEALANVTPQDIDEAFWIGELYLALGDREGQLRTAERGLELDPDDRDMLVVKLNVLLEMDEVKAAGDLISGLRFEPEEGSDVYWLSQVYRIRVAPMQELPGFFAIWAQEGYGLEFMQRLAEAALRSGEMETVRAAVHAWILSDSTPSSVWALASPWFEESDWLPALDRYLEQRPEPYPALLRVMQMDQLRDVGKVLELTARTRGGDDEVGVYLDQVYFQAFARVRPFAESLRELETHVAEKPQHALCMFRLASFYEERDPSAARSLLDRLEAGAVGDPSLLSQLAVARLELDLATGDLAEASRRVGELLQGLQPEMVEHFDRLNLYAAELAFREGDPDEMRRYLDRIREGHDASTQAAALVIRWSAQWASGELPSYASDVQAWMSAGQDELRPNPSYSAQSILLAEGVVDRDWVRKVTGNLPYPTPELVAAVKRSAEAGKLLDAELVAIHDADASESYASRLARAILTRRGTLAH